MVILTSTIFESLILILNQITLFDKNSDACDSVWLLNWMRDGWNIDCAWAITLFEMLASANLSLFWYLTLCAWEHLSLGKKDTHLILKEKE